MKKEEILQKARREGNGEYEERVQGRIMTRSALAVVALCAFFWLARVFQADRLGLGWRGCSRPTGWACPRWTPGSCPPSPPATPPLSTCGCMHG